MKKQLYTIAALLLMGIAANAQVGIGTTTPAATSMLDITSTTAGLLKPRMTTGQRTAIASPATGLEVFDLTTNTTWFFNGTIWVNTAPITADVRLVGTRNHITSDAGPGTNGSSMPGGDNIALGSNTMIANVSGTRNVAMNTFALQNNTTGSQNIAIGQEALNLNTTASNNIALGFQALKNNTASNFNIAVGTDAMSLATGDATHGIENIAVGIGALKNNTGNPSIASSASNNVAVGNGALTLNTTGDHNTAIGQDVLGTNLAGVQNTGLGFLSLYNTKGGFNTGLGVAAGSSISTSSYNTAVGYGTMSSVNNVTGDFNTAIGVQALQRLTSGTTNVAVGHVALANNLGGSNNVAVGDQSLTALTTGNLNTAIGNYSAPSITTGSNNIAIGNGTNLSPNSTTGNDQMNIGNTIFGVGLPNAASGYAYRPGVSTIGIFQATPVSSFGGRNISLDINGGVKIKSEGATDPSFSITSSVGAVVSVPANASGNFYFEAPGSENFIFGGNVVSDNGGGTLGVPALPWERLYANNISVGGTILYGGLSGGHILPSTNNTYNLGSAALRWQNVFAINAYNTSDARLKTNIENVNYGLASVMKMRPVTYNWKTDTNANHSIGFLAQDMEKIIPEAVYVPKTKDESYAINYIELIPVLTKAIQEQQAELKAKDSKINAMEARMAAMEKAIELLNKK